MGNKAEMDLGSRLADPALIKDQCLVAGDWVGARSGATLQVNNPATGERIGAVPQMAGPDARQAIDAASAALRDWSALAAPERAMLLKRWHALLVEHRADLALILTAEQGKPLAEAAGEISYAAGYVEWYAEEARRIYGELIPGHQQDKRILVLRQPVGVVAAITPWNFPAAMVTRKLAPALAAGCTVVCKPASQTPLTALALAELAVRAGIPRGVLSVITGGAREIGAELTGDPRVRKISFTGSTAVGKLLMGQSSGTLKKLSLELGGNAPFIVFDDADLDAAVAGALVSKFRNTGQTCVCTNRFLVQEGVYEDFSRRLTRAVQALRVGNGLEGACDQGPLIDQAAVEKVEEHIADALAAGGKVLCGGRRHALGGSFFEPTVIAGANAAMKVAREETFGPVAPLFRFQTEAEAIALANDTEVGLASYIYTRDLARSWRVSEALEYGIVGVNTGLISTEVAPFGGIKESGSGREGSRHGILDYTELKYVCVGGIG